MDNSSNVANVGAPVGLGSRLSIVGNKGITNNHGTITGANASIGKKQCNKFDGKHKNSDYIPRDLLNNKRIETLQANPKNIG